MTEFHYTLNLQVQANTVEDLVHVMDEIKAQLAKGFAMAHDKNKGRRYALSIEEEKPFVLPENWELKE